MFGARRKATQKSPVDWELLPFDWCRLDEPDCMCLACASLRKSKLSGQCFTALVWSAVAFQNARDVLRANPKWGLTIVSALSAIGGYLHFVH